MIVIPAIDLRHQRVVRLCQGEAEAITTFSTDPVGIAQLWAKAGAAWLHIVDLDGAFSGSPQQLEIVARIASAVDVPLQLGGGIRCEADVRAALDAGASRVIIGSVAATNPNLAKRLLASYGRQLAIAIDSKDNAVRISGWTEASSWTPLQLMDQLAKAGADRFIITDVSRDGMLSGPNLELLEEAAESIDGSLIASGGIESLDDLRTLASTSVEAAIVGMALYQQRFSLCEAIAATRSVSC